MSAVPLFASKASASTAPSTAYGTLPVGHVGTALVESGVQAPWRTAGVFSGLMIRVTANDRTAGSTFKFRTGGANGNQLVSIGAAATGTFADATNTDTVAGDGELLNYQLIVGTGGTVFTWAVVGIIFSAFISTVIRYEALGAGTTIGSNNTVQYQALVGLGSTQTTEASEQFKIKTTGTLRNLFTNIGTNTRAGTTTFRLRKNGANGNMTCSVGASATGIFEDIANTDSVVTGDLVNYQTSNGSDSGSLTYGNIGCELATSNNTFHLLMATSNGASLSSGLTRYIAPGGGGLGSLDTTEDNVKAIALTPATYSNLECVLITNNINNPSTLKFRKNNANGNQSVSVPATTTGYFEDPVNSDVVVAADTIDYQVVTGASGSVFRLNAIGMLGAVQVTGDLGRPHGASGQRQTQQLLAV